MNTVKKGTSFETKVYNIILKMIVEKRFGIDPIYCKVLIKPSYWSEARESNITFDLSIEIWPEGADRCHLLYLIECKDYSTTIPVNDIEEFAMKIQQVAGYFVKGVFITTNDVQQGGFNILRKKNMMFIKVQGEKAEIELYNKQRGTSNIQIDNMVTSYDFQKEDNDINSGISSKEEKWNQLISQALEQELNKQYPNQLPGERAEGLDFLSKKIISQMTLEILNQFEPLIVKHGLPVPIERLMSYLTYEYGLRFVTNKPFRASNAYLNGRYNRKHKIIYINPEIKDNGLFAFVCAHEIAHFFLHEKLNISQANYERLMDSQYDPASKKFRLENDKNWIEWQANYFAGCLLMPENSLIHQLIKWQEKAGISRQGYIWLDSQPCNIRDFKVCITQLAYIFQVSRTILEFRMADLQIIKYENRRGYNSYSLFGNFRSPKTIGQLINIWANKVFQDSSDEHKY